jgi:hypothetical protein
MNIKQSLVRASFFLGVMSAIALRIGVWLLQRRTDATIAIIRTKTICALFLGGIALYWHLDTLGVRVQSWFDVTWLRLQWWNQIENLQYEIGWKSFLSYWDGFSTGAGWGLLLGAGLMFVLMRRQNT